MLRAALYARYSSDNQRYESITAQLRACREYCKQRGYIVVKVYTDEAISGTSVAGRDAFQQMILDSADDIFDVVVFHKIDRNARNEIDYYTNVARLKKNGIRYEYSAEGIDVSTANGKLTEGVKVAVAAWYSRNLSQEVKKGQKENALQAKFNGGRPPLGYKIVNQQYEIEPREAEAVRLIYDMYLHGSGYTQIAAELNRRGFVTRNGKPFAKNSLYEILGNERYTGTYVFNRITTDEFGRRNNHKINADAIKIPDAIPAIIDKDTFAAVELKRQKNKHRSSMFRAVERYLLSGKVKCAMCGAPMNGHRVRMQDRVYAYYCCNKTYLPAAVKCRQKQVGKDVLEKAVLQVVADNILSAPARQQIVKELAVEFARLGDATREERKALKAALAGAEQRLANLYTIIENGTFDDFDLQRLNKIKAEILDIKNKIGNLPDNADCLLLNVADVDNAFKKLHAALLANDEQAQRACIDIFVDEVAVGEEDISITLNVNPQQKFSVDMVETKRIVPHGNIKIVRTLPRSALKG